MGKIENEPFMSVLPVRSQISVNPVDLEDLVCFWDFQEAQRGGFHTVAGERYKLRPRPLAPAFAGAGPWGKRSLRFDGSTWLECPRAQCPGLDIHGPDAQVTVVAWLRWHRRERCQFIAGMWDETNRARQYGLFLNITQRYNSWNNVHAHISSVGSPTGDDPCCVTYATGATQLALNEWYTLAMSYDGHAARVYINGILDTNSGSSAGGESLNPYPHGIFDGGRNGADFTVGALDTAGVMKNWLYGDLGGLAVYRRALAAEEMQALHRGCND